MTAAIECRYFGRDFTVEETPPPYGGAVTVEVTVWRSSNGSGGRKRRTAALAGNPSAVRSDLTRQSDDSTGRPNGCLWSNRSDNPCWPERTKAVNARIAQRSVVSARRTQRRVSRFHGLTERLPVELANSWKSSNRGYMSRPGLS